MQVKAIMLKSEIHYQELEKNSNQDKAEREESLKNIKLQETI